MRRDTFVASGIELETLRNASANRNKVGKVTSADVRNIAEQKMKDLNAVDIDGAVKMIEGTARSMGITVAD